MSYQTLWVRYFLLTTACELLVAYPLLRAVEATRWRRVSAVMVANLASHPLVWFVLARVIASRTALTLVAEPWAVASEAFVYALVFPALRPWRALGVSALSNALSFVVGAVAASLVTRM